MRRWLSMGCGIAAALGAQQPAESLLVQAPQIWLSAAPDRVLKPGKLLIRDGKVALVGDEIPADAESGARKLVFSGVVVPGLVNAHAHLGFGEDLAERSAASNADLKAADAIDLFAEPLGQHARLGVTTVAVAPLSASPFSGMCALVRLGREPLVVDDAGYLKLALVASAFDQERAPTSMMGVCDLVRKSFARARTQGDPVLKSVLSGGRRLVVHASSQSELRAALELCEELAIRPAFLGADESMKFIARLKALQATVLLPPLSPRDKKERLELPAALAAAGISFGFVAEHPDQLRLSAALALRHGAPRLAVLAALTQVPAELLGVGEQCGTLLRGRYADFVVFDGDPLELTSRITAVHAAGRPVPAKEGS